MTGKGMARTSAGLLLFRKRTAGMEVFLVHPGGPFWRGKDLGAWSIPKGEIDAGEDPLAAARRELTEETGVAVEGDFIALAPVRQKGGKIVVAWAIEADCDASAITSISFSMEWPPKSGKLHDFPEVDKAAWFALPEARKRINSAQAAFLDELEKRIA
jgi:predicted NUDIX family NTP pyrophosphohydrolase